MTRKRNPRIEASDESIKKVLSGLYKEINEEKIHTKKFLNKLIKRVDDAPEEDKNALLSVLGKLITDQQKNLLEYNTKKIQVVKSLQANLDSKRGYEKKNKEVEDEADKPFDANTASMLLKELRDKRNSSDGDKQQ
jgi:rubrerythrin